MLKKYRDASFAGEKNPAGCHLGTKGLYIGSSTYAKKLFALQDFEKYNSQNHHIYNSHVSKHPDRPRNN